MGCSTCGTEECGGVGDGHESETPQPSELKVLAAIERKASMDAVSQVPRARE